MKSKRSDSRWEMYSLLVLVILAVVFVGVTGGLYYYRGPIVFEAVGSLGSVILSLLLVLLYFKQTNLMKRQQEFEKSLERPILHIEGTARVASRETIALYHWNYCYQIRAGVLQET